MLGPNRPTRTAAWLRRIGSVVVVAGLTVGLLAAPPAGPPAAQATTRAERDAELEFLALTNIARARAGLGMLPMRGDIQRVARQHSGRMASQNRLHHNPNFSSQITGWQVVAENVGFGPNVERIHQALMDSPTHRANILDPRLTEAGYGVVIRNGRIWVTQNFRRPRSGASAQSPSTTTYGDVSSTSVHRSSILTSVRRGVARPCSPARFCPDDTVTRAEFAGMLARAMNVPPTNQRRFTDVSGPNAAAIEALAAAGVLNGCSATRFCPNDQLTRQQMASLLANAMGLRSGGTSPFRDVAGTHQGTVAALHRAGVVNGCSSTRFCATDRVTRAQTASFLTAAFR